MTDKNVQIRDMQGNNLFPKTLGSIVINNAGANLGGVEAGAQVNKIETIKLNGTALSIVSKAVDIQLPVAAEYSVVKQGTAEEGFAATYQLTKDGTGVGAKINIPKDMVIQSGSVKTVTVEDEPYEGAKVGDKYIDIVLANSDNTHVYIPANSLVDEYTPGDATITIENRQIKCNLTELGKTFQAALDTDQLAAVNSGITADKVGDYDEHLADTDIHVTAAEKTAWSGKQNALDTNQLAAVNSGVTSTKVGNYDEHLADTDIHVTATEKTTWSGKQDALDTAQLAAVNSGITAAKLAEALAKQDALDTAQLAAVNSGITAAKVATYDGYASTIAGKADAATTLAGYGITDAITYVELV